MYVDFWSLPPEVNSARLSAGAGPMAHAPQIAGYQALAASHMAQSSLMMATTAGAAAGWQGAGSLGMEGAATPLAAWNSTVSGFAAKAAGTIAAMQTAYSTTVASTIHFSVAIANRLLEAALESSNFMGVNTIPIGVNNAQYAEFWAQNAGASSGYATAAAPLISALGVPLAPAPLGANPMGMASAAASIGIDAGELGAQALGSGLTEGTSATESLLGAAPLAASTAGSVANSGVGAQAGTQPGSGAGAQPTAGTGAPGSDQAAASPDMLSAAQSMAGPMLSAPSSAIQAATSPLTQGGSELLSGAGQFGSMGSAMMSPGLGTSGLGAGPGLGALTGGPGSAAGLSGGNGGFAGGGSAVSAALTKPSAGGAMSGPLGLPGSWWSAQEEPAAAAGARSAGAGAGGGATAGAGAPGMYGMSPAAAGRQARRSDREASEADKLVLLDGGLGAMPVFTDDGEVVYATGQGV
ncbi:hypothetical protein AWC17_13320 [Mycobacterium nebraskense]|uniref:PPE domain-containing protein n=1 Tax=Mycobacterium nebraskense TaxID=244292 RepID=A0A1X1Z1K9_9MYCO|nr:PPE domain-containing protein [Mycobacterium nebraskense]ORW17174.1 hypothetical protein AWC17_13320 [Mycobacterium nebraskense]